MATKVLMVCLGNICRSPLAEGILKSKVDSKHVKVDSAGTSAYHQGELPDQRSIDIANLNSIDITDQRSRPFLKSDFEEFDYIYVMDASNYKNVCELTDKPEHLKKVKMIIEDSDTLFTKKDLTAIKRSITAIENKVNTDEQEIPKKSTGSDEEASG